MRNPERDLLILLKQDFRNKRELQQEVESLNEILQQVESSHHFCIAHELVDRNFITSREKRILQVVQPDKLKPFRFLINKN